MSRPQRELRKQMRQRQRRRRTLTFAVIAVLVLGLTGYLLVSAFSAPELPKIAGNVIDVAADMGGFSMSEIRVKAGEPVTVRLTSLDNSHHTDGGGQHQWAVDELGVSIVAPPEGSNFATFTPDTPGKYTFYCDICCGGRANPTMNGTLIVEGRA
ncbi:MAG TPA: cupredoxin domain-containing protein [Anaerolineae bacterium]|nr:cupredoxin domain-containing protein [Anaerolineae bacterium]